MHPFKVGDKVRLWERERKWHYNTYRVYTIVGILTEYSRGPRYRLDNGRDYVAESFMKKDGWDYSFIPTQEQIAESILHRQLILQEFEDRLLFAAKCEEFRLKKHHIKNRVE